MFKSILPIAAIAAIAITIVGCGSGKPKLSIYTWDDYIDPDLVKQFERDNNCRVVMDYFDSNEAMLAKIEAGVSGYDIIVPTSYAVEKLAASGRLDKIDKKKLANIANIDPAYLEAALDATMSYGVPYMVTYTGLAYRKDKIAEPEHTWTVLETLPSPACLRRVTLLNDMRETIGAAHIANGNDPNSTDPDELAAARDTVIKWKKNIAKFDNEAYKNGIANGEFLLVHGYSGDIGQVQADDPDDTVAFFLPDEGFIVSCDELVIMANAPNKDLAYKFIDFIHDGANAAKNMEYTAYWCPNTDAYEHLSAEIQDNKTVFPGDEIVRKGKVIRNLEGDALKAFTKTWDEILAAD
ncbi:MAG: spermidine/putrescine ABC transporter substrate-binding protein [Kiritimatiellaeota bacterium]|nr:spermidine/putrescine ABC transporter substrate-binding protein [Kiritimatiellota bacterium]